MREKKGNVSATGKKQCAAYVRCVAVVIALSLLAAVFMSVAGSVPVRASGLVDDTVDESNLYSKYSISNYQLDYYADMSWFPTKFFDNMSKSFGWGVNMFTNSIWSVGVMLSTGTGYVVQEAFKLDFVNDMADDIGKNIQTLAGLSKSGVSSDGFYMGFLLLVILVVGVYVAYTGLFRREISKALGAVVNMLLVFLLTAGFIVYAPDYIKNINEFSSDVSGAALDLGTQLVMPGNEDMGADAVDRVRNTLFSIQVYKPWLLLQFGTTDEETIGSERIESILSVSPATDYGDARDKAVKADVETYENTNMTVVSIGSRLSMVLFIVVLNLIISLFVIMMAGLMLLSQLLFIIFAMFLPISLVLSMFPTYNGMAKKALLKVFNTIMMRAGLTLAVTVAFSLSAMVYSLSSEYPFFMVAFLQIVVYAGVYLKLNDILGMISLQDGQGGNRRGALLRSLGRYVVMRRILGGRGRYSHRRIMESDNASSSGGNGGGGSSGRSSPERSRNASNTRSETSASSEGVRQTYGVIDESSGQKLNVSAERLQRFRDRKLDASKQDGSSASYRAKRGPDLKVNRTYGDVIDYEPNVGKFDDLKAKRRKDLREMQDERVRADMERGALKAASREKSELKWRAENGEAVSGQKINASKEQLKKYNGNRGIERAMAKGDIYRGSDGKLHVPKNAPSNMDNLSGENAGKISRETGEVRLEYGVVGESSKQKLPVSGEDMQRFRDADARGKINADYRAKKGPGLKVNQTYGTIVDYEPNVGKFDESKTERPVTESASGMERHSAETKMDMSQTVKTGTRKKLKSSRQTVVRSEFHSRSGRAEKDDGEPGKEK